MALFKPASLGVMYFHANQQRQKQVCIYVNRKVTELTKSNTNTENKQP